MKNSRQPDWTFLTNHAHVLVCLNLQPGLPMREIAARVGITERAVQRIISELEIAGVLRRRREGRTNSYEIYSRSPLRHPLEAHCTVGDLIGMVSRNLSKPSPRRAPASARQKTLRPQPAP